MHRVFDHYLHTAHAAAHLLAPRRKPIGLDPLQPGVAPEHLASPDGALAWFEAERSVLLAAIAAAAETGSDVYAWQLPWALAVFLDRLGHWNDYATTQRIALAAAQRLGDRRGQAHAHHELGHAHVNLGRYEQAHDHLIRALELHGELDDRAGEARRNLASLRAALWRRTVTARPSVTTGMVCGCSGPRGTTMEWPGP